MGLKDEFDDGILATSWGACETAACHTGYVVQLTLRSIADVTGGTMLLAASNQMTNRIYGAWSRGSIAAGGEALLATGNFLAAAALMAVPVEGVGARATTTVVGAARLVRISDGSQSWVRGNSRFVVKRLKRWQFRRRAVVPLALREEQAAIITGLTNEIREFAKREIGDIVPELSHARPGVMVQERVEGQTIFDLDADARLRAISEYETVYHRIARRFGFYDPVEGQIFLETENFQIKLDDNIVNFRFHPDGTLAHWFDPILVVPKW